MLNRQALLNENPDTGNVNGCLLFAIKASKKQADYKTLSSLISAETINSTDDEGNTPLICAIENRFIEKKFIELLFLNGANVNQCNLAGITPLHRAIASGRSEEIIKLLIRYGADLYAKTKRIHKNTPLHFAVSFRKINLAQILLNHGVNVDLVNGLGRTPLFYSVMALGSVPDLDRQNIEFLLENGADVNKADNHGETALHMAIKDSCAHIDILLQSGADIYKGDNMNLTPLDLTYSCPDKEIVALLTAKKNNLAPHEKAKKTLFQFWSEVDFWHKVDKEVEQSPLPSKRRLLRTNSTQAKADLPHIIFTESHCDPAVLIILKKLTLKLQELGYKCFFMEWAEGKTSEDYIRFRQELIDALPTSGLDEKSLDPVIAFVQAGHEEISFVQGLSKLGMGFHSVDLKEAKFMNSDYMVSKEGIRRRDKKMASAFLAAPYPVFGSVGYKHALGIQNEILTKLPLEKALNKFCFLHIYSKPSFDEYESKLRVGKMQFPLGITPISVNKMDEEKIIEIILRKISGQIVSATSKENISNFRK